jgi:hypothetical protein
MVLGIRLLLDLAERAPQQDRIESAAACRANSVSHPDGGSTTDDQPYLGDEDDENVG